MINSFGELSTKSREPATFQCSLFILAKKNKKRSRMIAIERSLRIHGGTDEKFKASRLVYIHTQFVRSVLGDDVALFRLTRRAIDFFL